MNSELSRLRDRVDELTEENEQLKALIIGGDYKRHGDLTRQEYAVLKTIAKGEIMPMQRLVEVLEVCTGRVAENPANHAAVQVSRLRKKIKPYGVTIYSKAHYGYWIEAPDVERLRVVGVL